MSTEYTRRRHLIDIDNFGSASELACQVSIVLVYDPGGLGSRATGTPLVMLTTLSKLRF